MIITQQLEIDLAHQGVMPRLNAMHNDANSRVVEISLLENGTPWQIPADVTAAVNYNKPDGTAGLYDTLPDGSSACAISGSTVTVFLAPQVLTAPGLVQASVILTRDTAQLATFPLSILVEAIPGSGAEKSVDYYHYTTFDALNRAIGNLADLETGDQSSLVAAVNEIAGGAGTGTVKSVNGVSPDENGNVAVDLTEAVNDALTQAKASGEFDGKDGKDGLSVFVAHITAGDAAELSVSPDDVVTNRYSVKIGDILLTDDGKIFTVNSFEMSSDLAGNTELYYNAGFFSDIGGAASTGGTSVTVQSVSESTEDGGSNIVTFSDGKTVTIKNGNKGSDGADGTTPHIGDNGNWWLGDTDTGVSASSNGSGGSGSSWELVTDVTLEEDVQNFVYTDLNATELQFAWYGRFNNADDSLANANQNVNVKVREESWAPAATNAMFGYVRPSGNMFWATGELRIVAGLAEAFTKVVANANTAANPTYGGRPHELEKFNYLKIDTGTETTFFKSGGRFILYKKA